MAYKVVAKNPKIRVDDDYYDDGYEYDYESYGGEVRVYDPSRRTITVGDEDYYVRFPHMIFMRLGEILYCGFLNGPLHKRSIVYLPPLGNISCRSSRNHLRLKNKGSHYQDIRREGFSVCLGDYSDDDLGRLIDVFWGTSFCGVSGWIGHSLAQLAFECKPSCPNAYENWSSMNLYQVMQAIKGIKLDMDGYRIRMPIHYSPFGLLLNRSRLPKKENLKGKWNGPYTKANT